MKLSVIFFFGGGGGGGRVGGLFKADSLSP